MATSVQIRILAVDDHPLLSEGIAAMVLNQRDMLLVGEARSGQEAVVRFRECRPDVTLMDLRLPDMSAEPLCYSAADHLVNRHLTHRPKDRSPDCDSYHCGGDHAILLPHMFGYGCVM